VSEIEFFKPSDCESPVADHRAQAYRTDMIPLDKANRLLKERGKVVYSHRSSLEIGGWYPGAVEPNPTHSALLINIEPIRKDSAESLLKEILDHHVQMKDQPLNWVDRARKLLEEK